MQLAQDIEGAQEIAVFLESSHYFKIIFDKQIDFYDNKEIIVEDN